MTGTPTTSTGATPLSSPIPDTLTKFEYFRVRPRWLFVRIESSTGHVGWGEATLEGNVPLHIMGNPLTDWNVTGIPKLSRVLSNL
jgi:hypothetical protein